jgi:PAS domain S-box-containing protein
VKASDRVDGPGVNHALIPRGVFLLIILSISLLSAASRADDARQRVLILHAYNYTFPATTLVSEAARKRLIERNLQRIDIEADFLDLARLPGEEHALSTATYLHQKYAGTHFDLVLVIGVAAVPFIIKYREIIAPGAPVVFAGGTPANLATIQLPSDVTGVLTGFDPDKILDLAERLQPKAHRLVVVGGSDALDRPWQTLVRKSVEGRKRKIETTYRFDLTYDALLAEVSNLPRDTIVMLLTMYADSSGRRLIPQEVAAAVAKAGSAPVYAPFETFLGTGIVGGYIETYESLGIAAADMAMEILSGADPATLPPRVNPEQAFRVDAKAMARWGFMQGKLPPGSIVLFREPTLWDDHRYLVSATALVLALQSAVVGALLFQRRRRRQAETSLKESEDRMTFAAASANVGLWQFDRSTNKLWATEHSRTMLGLAKEFPLTRETFLAAVHPEDRLVAVNALRGVTKGQSAVADVRIVLSDGQVRWIRVRVRSHLDDHGSPDQLSGIFVDITERKTAEFEADLQRQEVTHLMRVSVLGELSGAIAHEVNQPLTAILSNAQAALYLLAQDAPNLADVRDALQDIVQEDNRAGEVVHRLRTLLKKGETRFEPVDVNELVDLTIALLRNELIVRRTTIETDLETGLPGVSGDSVQLQQVLLNLVINAMDAMASTPTKQRRVKISTHATLAGTIEVLVKDYGLGIQSVGENQPFAPFYTTKDHGLGLGLTICSTIVQKHGGTITLRNDNAGGAVAVFSLPAQEMLMAAQ